MMRTAARRTGYALLERSLRRTFRRVVWCGPFTPPPAHLPVVIYANHHVFQDSYALACLVERVLGRRTLVWMEELERFPFFGLLGARSFPAGDAAVRVRTIRATRSAMMRDPAHMLFYYPEGRLHPAAEGILPFPADRLARLDRVLPTPKLWWPVALSVTGWHDTHPTLCLTGGMPHAKSTGREAETLRELLVALSSGALPQRVLYDGRRGPHERWDFSRAAAILS